MVNVPLVARSGTEQEVLALYEPAMATSWTEGSGRSFLHCVLANKDPQVRVALAERVLDDGADAAQLTSEGRTTGHVLLAQKRYDPPVEAPLLRRLLDSGSDVNRVVVARQAGTPLYTLAEQFTFTDEFFAPFYDVVFARDDLDLVTPTLHGRSDLETFRLWHERRADLVRRAEELLRARSGPGITGDPDPVTGLRFPDIGVFGLIDGRWREVVFDRLDASRPVTVIVRDRQDYVAWSPEGEVERQWLVDHGYTRSTFGVIHVVLERFERIVSVSRDGWYRGHMVYARGPVIEGRMMVGLTSNARDEAAEVGFNGHERDGFDLSVALEEFEGIAETITVKYERATPVGPDA